MYRTDLEGSDWVAEMKSNLLLSLIKLTGTSLVSETFK